MNHLLSRIVADLQEKYHPQTIILYGSYAGGDHTAASDIDVVCFVEGTSPIFGEGSSPIKDAREFDGVYLDAWVYDSETMSASTDELLRVADGYCLYDSEGRGDSFLKALQQRIEQGPKQLSAAESQHTKQWVYKMLERSKNLDVESSYRRYWLAVELLQIYFDLRGLWYFGPKKSLTWLSKNDPTGYQLFSKVYTHPIKPEDLNELAAYVTNTD